MLISIYRPVTPSVGGRSASSYGKKSKAPSSSNSYVVDATRLRKVSPSHLEDAHQLRLLYNKNLPLGKCLTLLLRKGIMCKGLGRTRGQTRNAFERTSKFCCHFNCHAMQLCYFDS